MPPSTRYAVADGVHIAYQIGPYLEDRTPIRFAELLAREIEGYTPPASFA